MTTRSGLILQRNQSRKTRIAKLANSGPLYPQNTFAGLPYDVKYHFLHEFHFSPSDLLSLSHVNRDWRACSTVDSLWAAWYEVFPENVKMNLRRCNNVSKRDFVMLGLTAKCIGCKAWAGCISIPLMLRLCANCAVDNPLYKVVDEDSRVLYELEPKDIQHLVTCTHGVDNQGDDLPGRTPYSFVSERSLIDIAVKKHGGTFESIYNRTAAMQLREEEDYNRKVAQYIAERKAALSRNLPFRRRYPRDTRKLPWVSGPVTELSISSNLSILRTLYWKTEKMDHSPSLNCVLCEVELLELFRAKHGYILPTSADERSYSEEVAFFKLSVCLMPHCRQDPDGQGHHLNHFTPLVNRTVCPGKCEGAGICGLCCKERALTEHLSRDEFWEEMGNAVRAMGGYFDDSSVDGPFLSDYL